MCLSIKVVGTCVKVSAVLVLLLGVIGIVCGVSIGSDDIVVSTVQDTKKTIMGVTIAFSVFLVLLGLAGTIGAWRNSACCLAIYNIGIGLFFVAFLIISIAAFAVFKKYTAFDVQNTEQCLQQSWLKPLDDVAVRGGSYLCSKDCACDYNATASRLLVADDSNSTAADANATTDSTAAANTTTDSTTPAANTTTTDSTPAANTTTTDSTPAANTTTTDSTPAANTTTTDSTPAANTTTTDSTPAANTTVEPTPSVDNTTVVANTTTDSTTPAANTTTNDSTTNDSTPAANTTTTTNSTPAANTTDNSSSTSNGTILNVSLDGSHRVQDCPNYANVFSTLEREYAVSLELLERRFKCAGVCTDLTYYSFSDIDGGEPTDDCATVLVDMFVSYSKKIGAATIVITILLFLTLVASFCLCCHPDKRKQEGGFYQKMTSI